MVIHHRFFLTVIDTKAFAHFLVKCMFFFRAKEQHYYTLNSLTRFLFLFFFFVLLCVQQRSDGITTITTIFRLNVNKFAFGFHHFIKQSVKCFIVCKCVKYKYKPKRQQHTNGIDQAMVSNEIVFETHKFRVFPVETSPMDAVRNISLC